MFYLFTFLSIALVLTGFILAKRFVKNKEKFDNIISKTLKISVVVFCVISFLTILLPDAFALCFDNEALTLSYKEVSFAIVRWFTTLSFIMLPIAVFFKNRTIRNIAIYFCSIMTIVSICYYPAYLEVFTSTMGRGINSIPVVSESVKQFLINPIFRSIIFGLINVLALSIPVVLAIQEKHIFNFKICI